MFIKNSVLFSISITKLIYNPFTNSFTKSIIITFTKKIKSLNRTINISHLPIIRNSLFKIISMIMFIRNTNSLLFSINNGNTIITSAHMIEPSIFTITNILKSSFDIIKTITKTNIRIMFTSIVNYKVTTMYKMMQTFVKINNITFSIY